MRFRLVARLFFALWFFCVPVLLSRSPVEAQANAQAWPRYALTVYAAPDRSHSIIGVIPPRALVILEARSADATWLIGRTVDGIRGWMESRYLDYAPSTDPLNLPFSAETMFAPGPSTSFTSYRTIDLNAHPIIPINLGQARAIFERGTQMGANPRALSKIGDCISDNRYFLSPFGWRQYNLGQYSSLQPVIDYFSDSLAYDSLAAYEGLVTTAVLDPLFANPLACLPGETPLRCEYRVHTPSVAIIMFGAQDLLFTSPEQFERNLRRIVHETIQAGIVPILSTFPGNLSQWKRAIEYNQIVVQIALDYDIPLMNLWRALEMLPNHGLNEDGRHLSLPLTDSGDLSPDNLQRGYPMRNLITLQTLDAVWRGALY